MRHCLASFFVFGLVAAGCGTTPGEKVRPKDPTFEGARGGASSCKDAGDESTPLIVDWNPEERGDLEVAMKQGVAVFHHDCKTTKLLQDCKVEGPYSFLGITKKEQVIAIENADQAQANLPLHGASIGASMASGSSLDVGLIMVGKKTTAIDGIKKSSLGSHCEGATHYVHSATVGAFAMRTLTSGAVHAKAALDVFGGAGASGSSTSAKDFMNKDGEVESCKGADVDATSAPSGCGAPVRIRLLPITDDGKATTELKEVECAKGLVEAGGKCTAKSDAKGAFECEPETDGRVVCEAQCAKGNAQSCWNTIDFYQKGTGGVAKDDEKAESFAIKGCDLGDLGACSFAGLNAPDRKQARALQLKACDGGYVFACTLLASKLNQGDDADAGKAYRAAMRACDGGEELGCFNAASILGAGGNNLKANVPKAVEMYGKLCDDPNMPEAYVLTNCADASELVGKKDPVKAKRWMKRSCDAGYSDACAKLKKMK